MYSSLRSPPLSTPLEMFLSRSRQEEPPCVFANLATRRPQDHGDPEGLGFFGDLVTGSCKKMMKRSEDDGNSAAAAANVVKGQWTAEEDSILVSLVKQHGVRKWSQIAKNLVGRIGKQCRERWHNHLRPDIKKDMWTEEEEKLLVQAHMNFGNRWAEIAKQIPGRSENSIKNHWNATKRRLNAKRRSKRKAAAKGGRCPPSNVLQDYIRSKTTLDQLLDLSKTCIASKSTLTPSVSATHISKQLDDDIAAPPYSQPLVQKNPNPSSIQDSASMSMEEDSFNPYSQQIILEQSAAPTPSGIIRAETYDPNYMHYYSVLDFPHFDDDNFLAINDVCQCMLMPSSSSAPEVFRSCFNNSSACYQPITSSSSSHLYSELYPASSSYLQNGALTNSSSMSDHLLLEMENKPQLLRDDDQANSSSSIKRDLDLVEMMSLQFSSSQSSSCSNSMMLLSSDPN